MSLIEIFLSSREDAVQSFFAALSISYWLKFSLGKVISYSLHKEMSTY